MLIVIGVSNFVDRQIIYILLEDIKRDLQLSDTQLSLLSSTIFAIFYSIVGIPIARLAERWDRGKIITISLFFWSLMTVASGLVVSFAALVMTRIGVGVGQAGVGPASHALIAERFEPERRATALAIFTLGGTLGIFLALGLGGWLGKTLGWQMTFVAVGLPGMLLAPLMLWLLRDTRVSAPFAFDLFKAAPGASGLTESVALFWQSKVWRFGAIAVMFTHLATYGIGNWLPSMLQRSYGMTQTDAGLLLAVAIGLGGAVGSIAGGVLTDRMVKRRGPAWLAWTVGIAFVGASLIAPFIFMTTNEVLLVSLLLPYFALMLSSAGVQFAIGQTAVSSNLHATSSAVLILIINLIGLGIGPTVTGLLSDFLAPSTGAESLRYAMLIMSPLSLGTAFFYYLAGCELARASAAQGYPDGE